MRTALLGLFTVCTLSCTAQHTFRLELDYYSCYSSGTIPQEIVISTDKATYDSVFREVYLMASGNDNPDILFRETYRKEIGVAGFRGNKRYILYNREMFDSLLEQTRSLHSIRSVIAHELSHLLNNHPLRRSPNAQLFEMEADYYSGKILRSFQSGIGEALMAMEMYGNEEGTPTHPPKQLRLDAIRRGWINQSLRIFNGYEPEFDELVYTAVGSKLPADSVAQRAWEKDFLAYVVARDRFHHVVDSVGLDGAALQTAMGMGEKSPFPLDSLVNRGDIGDKGIPPVAGVPGGVSERTSALIYGIRVHFLNGRVFNERRQPMGTISGTNRDEYWYEIRLESRTYYVDENHDIWAFFPDGSRTRIGHVISTISYGR